MSQTLNLNTNRLNIAIVAVMLAFLVLGCDAWVTLNGHVLDDSGNPIAGANIIVTQNNEKVANEFTEKDGSFHIFKNIAPGPIGSKIVKVTVSKDNYETFETEFNWTVDDNVMSHGNLVFTLKRIR
jgi:hypothetical protein